jgi:adenosylmethionine-8-amino-7-oxononanoate aminotransferase
MPRVANARQCGTIIALDVIDANGAGYLSEIGPKLRESFRGAPVLLRPLGNTVYVMPPYCIDEADLAAVQGAIAEAISTIATG